jgi:hypothetical protein
MRRTGCGTGHSRVTELGRLCDAIGASDRDAGRPVTTPLWVAGYPEKWLRPGRLPCPAPWGRCEDQAAVWLNRRPKLQVVPWSA